MHDSIIGLYERHASAFDRLRSRSLFERHWIDRFEARLPRGATLLDVGCGTGEPIAGELIKRGFSITGIDAAAPMIDLCKARFPDQEWLVADLRTFDLPHRFDGIIAWHSLIHIHPAEQAPSFARFARHLRPEGVLMFTTTPVAGERIGKFEGEPLYHGGLAPEHYREVLEANGFRLLDHRISDPDCGGATVWLAQMSPASGLDGSA